MGSRGASLSAEGLSGKISKISGVSGVMRWAKGGHDRLYVNFRSQNRFSAEEFGGGSFINLKSGKLTKGNFNPLSGAGTRKRRSAALNKIGNYAKRYKP